MKLTRLLACGLCAVALISTLESRRAMGHPAAIVKVERTFSARRNQAQGSRRTSRHSKARRHRKASAPLPVVQEINGDGLRKILQRDQSTPRPLLINFWATWCGPCREEFPDLVRIGDDYKTRNLDFILVSLDDPSEIKTTVPRFLQRMRAQMSVYLLNEDDSNAAISAVDPEWAGSMPATFLLDRAGQVVYKHLGPINPEELRTELEKVTEKQ
jgi:thiol-disulfide isomerase/thioredoxin